MILYDSVGLYHRAGDHRPPPGVRDVARWVTWTTLVGGCVEINHCAWWTRLFFKTPFLGDDAPPNRLET